MINLSLPTKGIYVGRGFGRRYLWIYKCPDCGGTIEVRCSSWIGIDIKGRGITPQPGIGAIYCPHCKIGDSNNDS